MKYEIRTLFPPFLFLFLNLIVLLLLLFLGVTWTCFCEIVYHIWNTDVPSCSSSCSHTLMFLSVQQLQSNDLSAANNYTFTEMILQSWYFIRERQLQMTSETRHKDMSLLKSPVCNIMSSSESKGNFIPKTKIIFPLNLLKQFLWFFGNFKDDNSWLEIHLNN